MTVGVLALQGDFAAHQSVLHTLGVSSRLVRTADELNACDALILPGGESTAMACACDRLNLWEPLRAFVSSQPVLGTCAGLILLAHDIEGAATTFQQRTLNALDISVARNAYGRQVESFEAQVPAPLLGDEPLRAAFIRAPQILRVGDDVETLAEYEGRPVLVRRGTVVGCAFHPEIVGETRVHRLWMDNF